MSDPGQAIEAALAEVEAALGREDPAAAQPHLNRVVAICARLQATETLLPAERLRAIRARLAACVAASEALRARLAEELQQQGTLRRAATAYGHR